MRSRPGAWACAAIAAAVFPAFGAASSRALVLPVPSIYQERADTLAAEHEKLKGDLKALQRRVGPAGEGASGDESHRDLVSRIFALMADLAANRQAIEELKEELQDLFAEPPPPEAGSHQRAEAGHRGRGHG